MKTPYENLQDRLAQGWNTWNTRSVLSHVLLPEGLALNLCLKQLPERAYLKEALIGRRGVQAEVLIPGPRTYDGSFTSLHLTWKGLEMDVLSATEDGDLLLWVNPRVDANVPALLVLEAGLLWNRPGMVSREADVLVGHLGERSVRVYATQATVEDPYIPTQTPYLAFALTGEIGISTGRARSLDEIKRVITQRRATHLSRRETYGDLADVYDAMQTCLAWDTVYDPEGRRVISPVSRLWNVDWGGFVLFDWDTYFAAYMAGLDNKELAYANAVEITREKTESGFIPNFGTVLNLKSRDRSQPPVGSLVFRELYRRYGEAWLLEEVFDDLLAWNRWWPPHRSRQGLLAWGSDPFEPLLQSPLEVTHINDLQGAAWESGLDNSPMYDAIPYDEAGHIMLLADAGLTGLYVMDCEALADIARVLGKTAEVDELRQRAGAFRASLAQLWDAESGIYCNKRLDSGEFSHRLSPTNFYPLLGRAATQAEAQRMIEEHFYNPDEFWGEWIMPTIARNDPAYPDQEYWRGRIWGPTNFLVYLGLRNYDLPQAREDLAEKSKELFLKNWREHGYVAENYNCETGQGGENNSSDRYYHWGALLGFMALIEAGYVAGWESPLDGGEQPLS